MKGETKQGIIWSASGVGVYRWDLEHLLSNATLFSIWPLIKSSAPNRSLGRYQWAAPSIAFLFSPMIRLGKSRHSPLHSNTDIHPQKKERWRGEKKRKILYQRWTGSTQARLCWVQCVCLGRGREPVNLSYPLVSCSEAKQGTVSNSTLFPI